MKKLLCQKCGNVNIRHNGRKQTQYIKSQNGNILMGKGEDINSYNVRHTWTQKGYYCKRCGWKSNE